MSRWSSVCFSRLMNMQQLYLRLRPILFRIRGCPLTRPFFLRSSPLVPRRILLIEAAVIFSFFFVQYLCDVTNGMQAGYGPAAAPIHQSAMAPIHYEEARSLSLCLCLSLSLTPSRYGLCLSAVLSSRPGEERLIEAITQS